MDFILNLTKPGGQPAEVRELEAVGRFDMPEHLQIRRRPNFVTSSPIEIGVMKMLPPRYVFEAITVQGDSPKARIRAALQPGARTAKQLAAEIGVSVASISRTLQDMAGDVIDVGKGGPRNNATLYGLRAQTTTSSSQSLRDGEVESCERAS